MADKTGYVGRNPGDSAVTIARQRYTTTGITTDFTFTSGYVVGYFDVYVNGAKKIEGSEFNAGDGSTFSVLNGGVGAGSSVEAVAYKAFNAAATVADVTGNFSVGNNLTVGRDATVSGVGSFNSLFVPGTAYIAGVSTVASNLNVGSAITMVASSGVVSATSFYGDGSNLSNIISGVGVNSGGTNIGYGVSTLNFVGSGTTIEVSGTTANISAGGGGGSGVSSTGILTARGFANADDITDSLTLDDFYGTGTNYGMVGPITVTGSGTVVTVGAGVSYVII